MNRIKVKISVALGLAVSVVSALTLWPPAPTQGQQPPVPSEQIQKLLAYTGTWEGTGIMIMNGDTTLNKIRHENTRILNGWGLECKETIDDPKMGRTTAINLFGYEAGTGLIHMYTISTTGDTHDHKGKWLDDKNLTVQYDGIQDGKPMIERIPITFDSPTEYHWAATINIDGKEVGTFNGIMKKVGLSSLKR